MMKKTFFNLTLLAFFAITLLTFTSCGDDDGGGPGEEIPTQTLIELVNETDGLDSLAKYLSRYPALTAQLAKSGSQTFFAPDNDAFASLLETPGFPSNIDQISPVLIEGVLAYHVVDGEEVPSSEFVKDNVLTTLYIDPFSQTAQVINFNSDGTILTGSTNSNITATDPDIAATNGVMHIVESVMIPPSIGETLTPILGTNAGTILLGSEFTTLASAVFVADAFAAANDLPTLVSILAGTTVHNVFAPTNATFEAAGIGVDDFTGQQWYGIIANHVVIGDVLDAEDLTTGATSETAAMGTLTYVNTGIPENVPGGPGIFIDSDGDLNPADPTTLNAEVAIVRAADSSNGTVHVIAGILTPASPE